MHGATNWPSRLQDLLVMRNQPDASPWKPQGYDERNCRRCGDAFAPVAPNQRDCPKQACRLASDRIIQAGVAKRRLRRRIVK